MSTNKHKNYTNYAAYARGQQSDTIRYTDATSYGFEEHEAYTPVAKKTK